MKKIIFTILSFFFALNFCLSNPNTIMENSKKQSVIEEHMNKKQVDSVASFLKSKGIILEIKTLKYNPKNEIEIFEGTVSKGARKLPFASNKFSELEINYDGELNIMIFSK